ncbi:MAG: 4Fe-4S binding protein [Promethearchaeota archaeon]
MKIKIKTKNCKDPNSCLKCLEVCIPGVFLRVPKKKFKTDFESQVKINEINHRISVRFIDSCTLCMNCVSICPENAITIKK